jgi:hypothetical protein
MNRLLRPVRNERGATFVFFVALTLALLSVGAIAADVGMLMTVRSEAQRAAEAAALAGAAMYKESDAPLQSAVDARAREYAGRNHVGPGFVDGDDSASVEVEVFAAQQRVRVTVSGTANLLFARLLGRGEMPVSAVAAARVLNAGGATCVKPFALPDIWEEKSPGSDANANKVYDAGESWKYNPGVDHYKRWSDPPEDDPPGIITGYGGTLRDGKGSPSYTRDQGRRMLIKAGQPQNNGGSYDVPVNITPGIFLPFVLPEDPDPSATCGIGGSGGGPGASAYSKNICSCNPSTIEVDQEYDLKTGNMVGPTKEGIEDLIDLDPTATWDAANNTVNSPLGLNSPRVIKVVLYDPDEVAKSGKQAIKVNNIALLFVESYSNNTKNISGRFIKYADGNSAGNGTLVKVLQLVE